MSTRRAIYDPPPLFGIGFLKQTAVEVELIEWIEPPSPDHILMARIRVPVPKNALINILAKIPEKDRRVTYVIREVPAADITVIGADS